MTDGIVEQVIARCLVEPGFAEALRSEPLKTLSVYSSDSAIQRSFASADIQKILRFSGFINKIQHNHLWEYFPATRQLLRYYGIELDIFTAYRPLQLSMNLKASSLDDKTRSFLDFLEQFMRPQESQRRYPGLTQILIHERSIWEISRTPSPSQDDLNGNAVLPHQLTSFKWSKFKRLRAGLNGPLRVCSFEIDPEETIGRIREGRFDGKVNRIETALFLYQHDRERKSVVVQRPDRLTIDLLSRINAKRSVFGVISSIRRSGLTEIPPIAFREFFTEAAVAGVIKLYENQN